MIQLQHYHKDNRGSKMIALPACLLNMFETYRKHTHFPDRYGILDHQDNLFLYKRFQMFPVPVVFLDYLR